MHHSGLGGIIIDCNTDDLDREARFWSQALGLPPKTEDNDDRYIGLTTPDGKPYMELQSVNHPSRVHLDIKTDDVEAEVGRLEKLGARRVEQIEHWWVMEAPSGHRFCVIALHRGQDCGELNTWGE